MTKSQFLVQIHFVIKKKCYVFLDKRILLAFIICQMILRHPFLITKKIPIEKMLNN